MGNLYDEGANQGRGGPFDQSDRDPYKPIYRSNLPHGASKMLLHYIKQQMGEGGVPVEQQYRARAFSDIGNQQMQANMQARTGIAGGFGLNNPTGLTAGITAQNAISAPYGAANLGAMEAGRRAMLNLGQIGQQTRMGIVNKYSALYQPWFQQENIDVAREQIAAQAALASAAAGGGGGGGGL